MKENARGRQRYPRVFVSGVVRPAAEAPSRAAATGARVAMQALALALAGCTTVPASVPSSAPADAFFAAVESLCGRAFAGRVLVDVPAPTGSDPFAGKALVMHVRQCSGSGLRIPFHVGEDRSRTWVLSRTPAGLRLKHDHRHEDGSPDAVTLYGGDTVDPGTPSRQQFPVDEHSKTVFAREGLAASMTNTWALEIEPTRTFVYELSRPGGRLFRVEFDLTQAVAAPPPPWGEAN